MDYDFQLEQALGKRAFLQDKQRHARFHEVSRYCFAILVLAILLATWLFEGSDAAKGAWHMALISVVSVISAQWPARSRRKWKRLEDQWDETLTRIASTFEYEER